METIYGFILAPKKYHLYMFLKTKDVIKESQDSIKTKYILLIHSPEVAVPCRLENSHNVVQLNPDDDKYYLLTPYPTLMQPLKKVFTQKCPLLPAIQISIYNR